MKFLVDAQLPRRLALWLAAEGHDVLHTLDLPDANRSTDRELILKADADGRTVITKDSDFVDSYQLRGQPARLLLVSTGNISNDELLRLWHRHLQTIIDASLTSNFVELTANAVVTHA